MNLSPAHQKRTVLSGWWLSRYGAFMAANLLAHAGGLFACGLARRPGSRPAACDPTLLMQGCPAGQWPAPPKVLLQ